MAQPSWRQLREIDTKSLSEIMQNIILINTLAYFPLKKVSMQIQNKFDTELLSYFKSKKEKILLIVTFYFNF